MSEMLRSSVVTTMLKILFGQQAAAFNSLDCFGVA